MTRTTGTGERCRHGRWRAALLLSALAAQLSSPVASASPTTGAASWSDAASPESEGAPPPSVGMVSPAFSMSSAAAAAPGTFVLSATRPGSVLEAAGVGAAAASAVGPPEGPFAPVPGDRAGDAGLGLGQASATGGKVAAGACEGECEGVDGGGGDGGCCAREHCFLGKAGAGDRVPPPPPPPGSTLGASCAVPVVATTWAAVDRGDSTCETASGKKAAGETSAPVPEEEAVTAGGVHSGSNPRHAGEKRGGRSEVHEQDQGGHSTAAARPKPSSTSVNPRRPGEKGAPYIVQWADYHPLEEHPELLARALRGYGRCSGVGDGVGDGVSEGRVGGGGVGDGGGRGDGNGNGNGGGGGSSRSTSTSTGRITGRRGSSTNSRSSSSGDDFDHNTGDDYKRSCGSCCWELVERRNAATTAKHPSDFSLIRWLPLRASKPKSDDANTLPEEAQQDMPLENLPRGEKDDGLPSKNLSQGEKGESEDLHQGVGNCGDEALTCRLPATDLRVGGAEPSRCAVTADERDGLDGGGVRGECSCPAALAGRAMRALRSSPGVKSVFREKALTRGISALPDLILDLEQVDQGEEDQEDLHSPSTSNQSKVRQNLAALSDRHKSGDSGTGVYLDSGEEEVVPNPEHRRQHQHLQHRNQQHQQESWWLQDGVVTGGGQRRRLGGGGGGEDGGAGRLRGSSPREEFVHAGKQGKPLHDQGFKGAGVRVAIFDTGLEAGEHDFDNVVERINWTDEDTLEDKVGHGTHIAGVIGGRDTGCFGFAPEADLFVFRVFSSEQVSYTSWFLDAFNYALFLGVDVINLSIGGPDFKDQPFVDKVRELSANGVVVVSAVGNDGPTYGTQHNPADQMDTIGVGAVSDNGRGVAGFQSRGMTTWELPGGHGRVKPDVIAVGQHVLGPKAGGASGQCSGLSGTSVASPVVAGAVALLASTVPKNRRRDVVNPASIKQVLTESARRVREAGVFEQGAGVLDVVGAFELLKSYTPRATLLPPELDLTDPYMWPFSRQPLYYSAQPVVLNVTVVNGMGVTGSITSLAWAEETFVRGDGDDGVGNALDVKAEFSEVLWPWSGYLAVSLSVSEAGRNFQGLVLGALEVTVQSLAGPGESYPRTTHISLPVTVSVVPTPDRRRRLLWDQFHSVPYPPSYSPRDYLGDDSDMLDRLGDHPHTNFRTLFEALLDAGYYVETLGSDWSCFDAANYGALLVVDPEAELSREEKAKLEADVKDRGLSLVLFADWYSEEVVDQVRFVDDNTRMPWTPLTGGSNVPAINEFLLPAFGMALGGVVLDGLFSLPGGEVHLAYGNAVSRMPPGGLLLSALSLRGAATRRREARGSQGESGAIYTDVPVIGALDTNGILSAGESGTADVSGGAGGRVFLFGDSSCADDAALDRLESNRDGGVSDCLWLFKYAVRYACEAFEDPGVFRDAETVSGPAETYSGGTELVGVGNAEDGGGGFGGYSDGSPLPRRPGSGSGLQEHPGETTYGHQDKCGLNRFQRVPTASAHAT
eukprot:g7354.t1